MTIFEKTLDPTEAPTGYYAVLKKDVETQELGNICRACDWRPYCHSRPINEMPRGHNCRGYELIGQDGKLYVRADGCSVVFKRLRPNVLLA